MVEEFKIVFWDFDGVIKESVTVKSLGYANLFSLFGKKVVDQVNKHHESNGGVSRFEKIPLYLNWAGQPANSTQVQEYCDRYSKMVRQAVIDSPWVPGVYEYLKANHPLQEFILITGTPQEEIEQILKELNISSFFKEVYGAPQKKALVVKDVLKRFHCLPDKALVVGDSKTDLEAARENNVAFLLRRTHLNHELQKRFKGPSFENLEL